MTHEEEKYVHFASCIENLNEAWRILKIIMADRDNPLTGAAFEFALVEYSKPYKVSRGNGKHVLCDLHVPIQYKDLHKKLVASRDQINAHADLTVKQANLIITNTDYGKCATLVQNIIYGTEEVRNIRDIIDLIEKTLDSMYVQIKVLEHALPTNSF